MIRTATTADVAAIRDIYAPYVSETAISLENEVPSIETAGERLTQGAERFPWLVYDDGGIIQGYAYAGAFRARPAYAWSVESTVYVRQSAHGRGIGWALYERLFDVLRRQGAINILAVITLPNDASVQLHERLGFKPVARIADAGYKLGAWWDVGFWQRSFKKPAVMLPLGAPLSAIADAKADAAFLDSFLKRTVPREEWTHRAHLRFAWLTLRTHGLAEAHAYTREHIQRYNEVVGARIGYHDTITRAYLILMAARMSAGTARSFDDFERSNADLFTPGLASVLAHYSPARLWTDEAKASFCAPDLKPLPLA
jgi:phosphinothricin acetyltransferase